VKALKEMARVMKSGARLGVLTFVKQDLSILKKFYERVPSSPFSMQESLEVLHFFDVEELRSYLSQTGFRGFQYDVYGSYYVLFYAEKA
jgi:ubiquinone/menaquinone biosynthesis C-methylase UbiE